MRLGSLLIVFSLLVAAGLAQAQSATQPAVPAGGTAAIIQLTGEINDYNRDQLFRNFKAATDSGVKTGILDLDTYGGLVTSGLEISRFLKRQDVHTIAFVQDKAISAG